MAIRAPRRAARRWRSICTWRRRCATTAHDRIHGVTLRVVAQEVTLGGKGSVTYPSLNVGPGETFQVRIDMQLMRPSQVTGGPLVQVDLDGVLFQDLSFFGPDRLNSRRTMTACEMEAQRDREHFKRILAQAGRRPACSRKCWRAWRARAKSRNWPSA